MCDKCVDTHGLQDQCHKCGNKIGGKSGTRFTLCGKCRKAAAS